MTTYQLHPPVVKEGPAGDGPLFGRFKLYRGISIIKNQDGTYTTERYPSLDELNAAAAYYLGGHIYDLTAQEATDLIAAGFSDNVIVT